MILQQNYWCVNVQARMIAMLYLSNSKPDRFMFVDCLIKWFPLYRLIDNQQTQDATLGAITIMIDLQSKAQFVDFLRRAKDSGMMKAKHNYVLVNLVLLCLKNR
jgi:hypothetical protein